MKQKRGVLTLKRPSVSPMWRIIVDTRDGSQDRLVPKGEVLHRYAAGELTYDLNNRQYAVKENGVCPEWLLKYNRAG